MANYRFPRRYKNGDRHYDPYNMWCIRGFHIDPVPNLDSRRKFQWTRSIGLGLEFCVWSKTGEIWMRPLSRIDQVTGERVENRKLQDMAGLWDDLWEEEISAGLHKDDSKLPVVLRVHIRREDPNPDADGGHWIELGRVGESPLCEKALFPWRRRNRAATRVNMAVAQRMKARMIWSLCATSINHLPISKATK